MACCSALTNMGGNWCTWLREFVFGLDEIRTDIPPTVVIKEDPDVEVTTRAPKTMQEAQQKLHEALDKQKKSALITAIPKTIDTRENLIDT